MSIRQYLPTLALALALVGVSGPVMAKDTSVVTQDKADQLQTGASETDVLQLLGRPNWSTRWMNGTHSIVYDYKAPAGAATFLYVTFDADGKLLQSELIENNNGDGKGDSGDSGGSV